MTTAARARPARQRVLAQAGFEASGLLRHGEQVLVSMVLPVLALVGLAMTSVPDLGDGERVAVATPGVLGLAVVSSAFTGQAILLAYERRYGVLRLLGTTPLGAGGLLAAKAGAVLAVVMLQVGLIAVVALVLGWRPALTGLAPALVVIAVGVVTFVAWACVLGGRLRAEAVLALANLCWVLMLALGGLILSSEHLPDAWGSIVAWLPAALLGDGLRAALLTGSWPLVEVGLLALWGGLGAAVAIRIARWSD